MKVRALTRVANAANEDALLTFALQTTAARVEERAQRADALVAMASAYLGGDGQVSPGTADNYQLTVHVDHAALTEGKGRSDYRNRWFFRRPDGRAVPACGYRAEDMTDDDIETADERVRAYLSADGTTRPPAEVSMVREPSAEACLAGDAPAGVRRICRTSAEVSRIRRTSAEGFWPISAEACHIRYDWRPPSIELTGNRPYPLSRFTDRRIHGT